MSVALDGTAVQVLTLLYVIDGGNVLMLERGPHKRFLPGWLVAPGGKVEPSEDVMEAAQREFFEETGLTPTGVKLRGSYTFVTDMAHNRSGVIYLLTANGYSGWFNPKVADGTLRWMSFEELYASDKVMEDHKVFMREIFETDNHIACIGTWKDGEAVEWADSRKYFVQRKVAA